jgi:hypothetical protein
MIEPSFLGKKFALMSSCRTVIAVDGVRPTMDLLQAQYPQLREECLQLIEQENISTPIIVSQQPAPPLVAIPGRVTSL